MATTIPLRGRRRECEQLDDLLDAVREGRSGALVVRGETGMGKSALLDYVGDQAAGCRVARASGVQSEMELAFAGVHQLCAPMLDRLDRLPEPQRDALRTAFGLSAGTPPDRFFVGLAVLSLLSDAAEERPVVCLVDDAQWLDEASAHALGFVARRLSAESLALVLAARTGEGHDWAALPEMKLEGLSDEDARALLASVISGPLDEPVRDRIVAETRGNPLALIELPRDLTPTELAGGFGLVGAVGLPGRIEQSFRRRLDALPEETQRLLLVAAAEPIGEPALVWAAADRLGIGHAAGAPASDAGLAEFGARVRFRHTLVRSAVYEAASPPDRRAAHLALAEATNPEVDPDRRAWHLAQAAPGPDEGVATELERSADRAQARGGLAAGAAFLEQAATLTPDPARRAQRALAAAQVKHQAGAPDAAMALLAIAESGPLDDFQRARIELLRAQAAFVSGSTSDAPTLYEAARRLEPIDIDLARQTYLDALCAIVYAGPERSGCDPLDVARAALAAERPGPPRGIDLLLDGLALRIIDGYATGVPVLRRALKAFEGDEVTVAEGLGWGWLACYIASVLFEHETQYTVAVRQVQQARDAGALVVLPNTLAQLAGIHLRNGRLATAAGMIREMEACVDATGGDALVHLRLSLAAFQGREDDVKRLMDGGEGLQNAGLGGHVVNWGRAMLYNGLGRYEEALEAAFLGAREDVEPVVTPRWALPELVEAAVRTGELDAAEDALRWFCEVTQVSGTDWALGLEERSRALLSEGEQAERHYRAAIEYLDGAGHDVELGRAHLIYGEWLRRERRRVDARESLRTAHKLLSGMGIQAFADRAARELLATGETARKRVAETSDRLTAQEEQIARLARDGLSNPEIGERLFISPRTVEYHLHKVFNKLGIRSRSQIDRALARDDADTVQPV